MSLRFDSTDTTLFGVPWESLDLDDVARYLADPRNEGLTWEAKGTTVRPDDIRSAVCAFANSERGGYLILGATQDQKTSQWTLEGWTPRDEPELWIENCLGDGGVDPRPPFVVRAWKLESGKWVAVVRVRPAAVPPCLTSSGEVWQRVTGKSVRVSDAASLRRLFERGELAEERARSTAIAGRADLVQAPPEKRHQKIVLSLATPSLPGDASGLVFRKSVYDAARGIVLGSLAADVQHLNNLGAEVTQHALSVWSYALHEPERGYSLRIGRHGSVAVGRSDPAVRSGLDLVVDHGAALITMWRAATRVLEALGVSGDGHVAHVAISLYDPIKGATEIARWASVGEPRAQLLESIQRESKRALGAATWEP